MESNKKQAHPGPAGSRKKNSIARAERDGTRAETRFCLSPKRTSPFKSVGASVHCWQPRCAHQL